VCLTALACVLQILTSVATTEMKHTHVLCFETFASRQANKTSFGIWPIKELHSSQCK